MGIKAWKLPQISQQSVLELQNQTGLPPLVCRILSARGISLPEQIDLFFSQTQRLEDPFTLKDMDKAVERINIAMDNNEKIAVYGDYDCDGITSTTLLVSYFQSIGANVIYYVPDREKEGYGLNCDAIKMLSGQKVELIITVDNGISAHEEVALANELSMDVIITDHHIPRNDLPAAFAIVNPHRTDCPSRFKGLAGVGVAFKLVCALEGDDGTQLLEYYSDLVTIGTIGDIVPLVGENRIIVRHGLAQLKETHNVGINALLEISGLADKALTSVAVAFGLVPRINAAGRMGCADDVIELLLTDDAGAGEEMAKQVNEQNVQRKVAEDEIMAQIDVILKQKPQILTQRVMVVSGKNWHNGVVGIVAARLVEKYAKPCLLFSVTNGVARGSGRSVDGFSLIQAITACSEHLLQYGGHYMAAGLTLPESDLPAFEQALQLFAKENYAVMPQLSYTIDCVLEPSEIDLEVIAELGVLEPFGAQNSYPVFLLRNLVIDGIYPTSDKKHIRIRFSSGKNSFYAVYFRMSETRFPYTLGSKVDIVADVSVGEYNGKPQLSVKIKDLRPSGINQQEMLNQSEIYANYVRCEHLNCDQKQLICPNRNDIAVVYKFLKKNGGFAFGEDALYFQLKDSEISYAKMLVALDVMQELELIFRSNNDDLNSINLVTEDKKVDLGSSQIMINLNVIEDGEKGCKS